MKYQNSRNPWVVWLGAALFFQYQFAIRISFGVMEKDLLDFFQIDTYIFSIIAGSYYYSYACMQIVAGSILDRYGLRICLGGAVSLCLIGLMIFAHNQSLILAVIGRILIGAGSAVGFLSCTKVAATWFPKAQQSLVIHFSVGLGAMGAVIGGPIIAFLITKYGWIQTIWCMIWLGIILGILTILLIKDRLTTEPVSSIPPLKKSLHSIMYQSQTWILGVYGMLNCIPIIAFGDIWGVSFLTNGYDLDKITASGTTSYIYIGLFIGGFLWSPLCHYLQSYRKSLMLSSGLSLILVSTILVIPPAYTSPIILKDLFFLFGLFSSGQFLSFPAALAYGDPRLTATITSVQNMINMSGGMISQPFIGWILETISTKDHATRADYAWALAIAPVGICVSILLLKFLQERYPQKSLLTVTK